MEVLSRAREEHAQVAHPLGVAHAAGRAVEADRPEVALVHQAARQRGRRHAGRGCRGQRGERAQLLAQERHLERLGGLHRGVAQRGRALRVTRRAAPQQRGGEVRLRAGEPGARAHAPVQLERVGEVALRIVEAAGGGGEHAEVARGRAEAAESGTEHDVQARVRQQLLVQRLGVLARPRRPRPPRRARPGCSAAPSRAAGRRSRPRRGSRARAARA